MKRTLLLTGLLINVLLAFAQSSVEAKIDPIEMMIGEQAQVTLTVQAGENDRVEFPIFQPRQQIVAGVEVIAAQHPAPNTLQLTLTSFDGNLYYLPPFKVKVNGKTVESKSLALKVVEVEVDTTKLDKFFGPKDVQDNPFLWSDWSLSFWLSVLMLVLLAVAYYLYLRLRDNKPIIARIKIVKRLLPHQKAMKEIEQIKADKMVSSENQKEYYTKLTDTLRKYIEERYGFSAMEMTSSEIIERLTASDDQQSLDELRRLFMTADLVKFAKYSTLINENDANLVNAIDFINQTKQENQPTEEAIKPQLSVEDQRSQKTRRLLKSVIWAVTIASALLLCYVIYNVYQLLN
ncbi:MAG: BatD family protein [Prevotella sp.]|nr:BatD family protein [Prevotella sp.]